MSMEQPGILAPLPDFAHHVFFEINDSDLAADYLARLAQEVDGDSMVVGVGASLAAAIGSKIPGLVSFPALYGPGVDIPSTSAALWCWLRGNEPGELFHRSRSIENILAPAYTPTQNIASFLYGSGLDLTGYEDGTENPKGNNARQAATLTDPHHPLAGSSFVAVQQWLHDFDRFEELSQEERDDIIGRRRIDNIELETAPVSSHIQRTAQEYFEPPAFLLRRSMPWIDGDVGGLMFVAFGHSFDAFDAILRRMVGQEDGIVDALFLFSRPLSGGYFWCPPVSNSVLDLSALGL